MKDGTGAGTGTTGSRGRLGSSFRRDLLEEYARSFPELYAEVRPCRDARFLERAAGFLHGEPELRDTFTVFPFLSALTEGRGLRGLDQRGHLRAFSRAAELLETVCVNLRLQPWRKEIQRIKTYTGPFVYGLQAVLSKSTIQSVLGSIGYRPHSEGEFRLGAELRPDRLLLLGFELLLARLECQRLLELQGGDQPASQEWLSVLQRRAAPEKPREQKRKTEEEVKEAPGRPDSSSPSSPERPRLDSLDRSILEMQRTYPDLAFRGRRLLQDQPHKPPRARPRRRAMPGSEPTPPGEGGGGRGEAEQEPASGRTAGQSELSDCKREGGSREEVPGGPPAASLRLTLRAAAEAEAEGEQESAERTEGKETPLTSAGSAAASEEQEDKPGAGATRPPCRTSSSLDEDERELRELARRMEQPREEEEEEVGGGGRSTGRRRSDRRGGGGGGPVWRPLSGQNQGSVGERAGPGGAAREEEDEESYEDGLTFLL